MKAPSGADMRPVPDYPGYYADSEGQIWSDRRGPLHRMRGFASARGYKGTLLRRGGVSVMARFHQLVCAAWHGPCPEGMECRHLDGNPANNHPENLEWSTHLVNMGDRERHGTLRRGEDSPVAKLTEREVQAIRERAASGEPYSLIAADFGIATNTARQIAAGRSWKHAAGPIRVSRRKLDAGRVLEIRRRVAAGERQDHVAASLGVSPAAVCRVVKGNRWAHVAEETA